MESRLGPVDGKLLRGNIRCEGGISIKQSIRNLAEDGSHEQIEVPGARMEAEELDQT